MKYTNKMGLPSSMASAITNDTYTMGKADISATGLVRPPKIRVLESRHSDEITKDVSDGVFILLGNNTHAIVDRVQHKNSLQEERLYLEVGGWNVSGQLDLYEDGIITDFKVTSVWAVKEGVKPDWEGQCNIYAELFRNAGFTVKGLQIIALLRDWRMNEMRRYADYPRKQVKVLSVPLWPHIKTMTYIRDRVRVHQTAECLQDDDIPICTPEERWHAPDKWAVVKGKNKKATRVLESEDEANEKKAALEESTGDKYRIDFREGSDKRCMDYCDCCNFCNHYKSLVPF